MEPHRLKDYLITQKAKDSYKKFETAVKKGDLDEVRRLIEAGEKLTTVDYNETVMHICVHPPIHITDAPIMELLIKAGGNPNVLNAKKETPLHYCGIYNRPDVCKVLLAFGADIGGIDKHKHTPYSRAQEKKAEEVCALLEAEEKRRKESKPNWEKVEAAKQFFSLRRGTINLGNLMKKIKTSTNFGDKDNPVKDDEKSADTNSAEQSIPQTEPIEDKKSINPSSEQKIDPQEKFSIESNDQVPTFESKPTGEPKLEEPKPTEESKPTELSTPTEEKMSEHKESLEQDETETKSVDESQVITPSAGQTAEIKSSELSSQS